MNEDLERIVIVKKYQKLVGMIAFDFWSCEFRYEVNPAVLEIANNKWWTSLNTRAKKKWPRYRSDVN